MKGDAAFLELYSKAAAAGRAAGMASVPRPMVVVEDGGFSHESEVRRAWVVNEGACGFAWVVVRPGNSAFAKWLVKRGLASKHYAGGVCIWISEYNQSIDRKEKHAYAMADVFQAAGIKAVAGSRLD